MNWLVARKSNATNNEWKKEYRTSSRQQAIKSAHKTESIQLMWGIDEEYQIGVFKNATDNKALYLIDARDKSNFPIRGLEGIVNSANSDFTLNIKH